MHVVIIPLLKCKSKDSADVNNYRPIAIAIALSKVLEQVMLSRLARYLWTADSQFGFKQAHGIKMAIFALKQTVDFYRNQDTPVYMCFLDTKNAFVELIIGPLQKNCWTERCQCILWNCLSFCTESKSLWYDGVTHYPWHSVVQMGTGKGDSYPLCWIMYIQIQHNETSMYDGPAKAITGRFSTRVRLGNEELNFVDEFRYLILSVTADCRYNEDIKKQFRRQNVVGNILVRKFSFAIIEAKIQLFQVVLLPHLCMCTLATFIPEVY